MIIGCCIYGYKKLLLFRVLIVLSLFSIGDGFVIHQYEPWSKILSTCPRTTQLPTTRTRPHTIPSSTTQCKHSNIIRKRHIASPSWLVSNPIKKSVLLLKLQTDERSQDDNDTNAKGIVSSLTDMINFTLDLWSSLFQRNNTLINEFTTASIVDVSQSNSNAIDTVSITQPPISPLDLLNRIRDDYIKHNYLWTGDLDVTTNFIKSCHFQDPTISFIGIDQYKKNIQNLRMILNFVTNVKTDCYSILLDIQLYENYIETRWNMVGTLSKLPWQPKIDVIGKTKFWFNNSNSDGVVDSNSADTYRIYFYDEIWEIPANQALLQLITPAGTIPNTYAEDTKRN